MKWYLDNFVETETTVLYQDFTHVYTKQSDGNISVSSTGRYVTPILPFLSVIVAFIVVTSMTLVSYRDQRDNFIEENTASYKATKGGVYFRSP